MSSRVHGSPEAPEPHRDKLPPTKEATRGSQEGDSSGALLGHVHDVRVAVRQHAELAPFASDAALLDAAKVGVRPGLLKAVDEDAARLEAQADLFGLGHIVAVHAGAQTGVGVVGARDGVLDVRVGHAGNDRT